MLFLGGAVVGALAAHCASVLVSKRQGGGGAEEKEEEESLAVAVGFFDDDGDGVDGGDGGNGDGDDLEAAGAEEAEVSGPRGGFLPEGPAGRLLSLLPQLLSVARRQVVLVHDDLSFRLATGRPPVLGEERRAGRVLAALPGAEVRILPAGGFGVRERLFEEVSRAAAGRVLLVVPAVGPCACRCHQSKQEAVGSR